MGRGRRVTFDAQTSGASGASRLMGRDDTGASRAGAAGAARDGFRGRDLALLGRRHFSPLRQRFVESL